MEALSYISSLVAVTAIISHIFFAMQIEKLRAIILKTEFTIDSNLNVIKETHRIVQEIKISLDESSKSRYEPRTHSEKWMNLKEAFKAPVKAVEVNERS
ncbi:MAG: hypothetical protein ACHQUC_05045 [Chlamydiales bacterium]